MPAIWANSAFWATPGNAAKLLAAPWSRAQYLGRPKLRSAQAGRSRRRERPSVHESCRPRDFSPLGPTPKNAMPDKRPTRFAIGVMIAGLIATAGARRLGRVRVQLGPGALRRPARLLGLQLPDRGLDRVQGQGLRHLPRPGPGDGLPRRHAGGADRRLRDARRLARPLARRGPLPAQQHPHLRRLPAARRDRLPRGHAGDRPDAVGPLLLPARLRPLPVRPADQLRDDRRLRLLRRARHLRQQAARCCRRCCPPSSPARCSPSPSPSSSTSSASPRSPSSASS